MKRSLILALAAGATLLCAGAARASEVQWSVGIDLPPIGTVISNGPFVPLPFFHSGPRYVAPPVVYRAPPVVYRQPYPFQGYRGYRTRYERPAPVFHGRDGRWGQDSRARDQRGDHDRRDDRGEQRRHH